MDRRGAVDLQLVTHQLAAPLTEGQVVSLVERDYSLNGEPGVQFGQPAWETRQLTCLMAVGVLQSYLRNTAKQRLARIGVDRTPDGTTLAQLAISHRDHHGKVGQSFEIAVAAAVNAQVPSVVARIRRALRRLGLPAEGRLGMVLLGMEKVAPDNKEQVYSLIADQLPDGGTVRTGSPGRPMTAQTALARISEQSWHSMRSPDPSGTFLADLPFPQPRPRLRQTGAGEPLWEMPSPTRREVERAQVSQLGRADAFVFCGSSIVPTSLKVNPRAVETTGWKDVPLWITGPPPYR